MLVIIIFCLIFAGNLIFNKEFAQSFREKPEATQETVAQRRSDLASYKNGLTSAFSACEGVFTTASHSVRSKNISVLREDLKAAEVQCRLDAVALGKTKVPKSLNAEQRKKLTEIKQLLREAYMDKSLACKHFREGLDKDFDAHAAKSEQYLESFATKTREATAKYAEVEKEL